MHDFAQWLELTPVSVTIKEIDWIIPLVQSIHIVTIAVVFGSILMIALRVLGLVRTDQTPAAVLARFAPWIGRGLLVLLLTGAILVLGEPIREIMSSSFWLKMGLIVVGAAGALAFRRTLASAPAVSGHAPFSGGTKAAAMATVVLWLTVIFLGRAIAYDVEVWGSLSLSPRAGGVTE
jgi:uncharacterized membrane protein SirB2